MKVRSIIIVISLLALVSLNQYKTIGGIKTYTDREEVSQVVKDLSQSQQIEKEEEIAKIEEDLPLVIKDEGIELKEYVINLEGQARAILSRDGSKAREVRNGEIINQPGEYFLTAWDEEDRMSLTKWSILGQWQESWVITSAKELEEILKLTLENFKTELKIQFNYGTFTLEEINEILYEKVQNVLSTYPKLTFEAYTITGRKEENPSIEMEIKYPLEDINSLKEYNIKLDKKILHILGEQIKIDMVDYEKEWQIYKYLVENIRYSSEIVDGQRKIIDTPMTHTMYGAMIDEIAVCDGYAKSLMYILNVLGIPTELVTGEADGIAHVWNKVEVQNNTYHVDATWGDLEEKQIGGFYDYFNENDEYMLRSHIWDNEKQYTHIEETFINLSLNIDEVYKIQDREEWKIAKNKLNQEKFEEKSIIFYNQIKNQWDERELISEICMTLEKSIEYNIIKKYDTLIINYRVYE